MKVLDRLRSVQDANIRTRLNVTLHLHIVTSFAVFSLIDYDEYIYKFAC
jgi:hypothetical protein